MSMIFAKSMRVALVVLMSACAGCGYLFGDKGVFRDKSEDYKKAPELPVVTVPEGADSKELHDLYAIPPVQESVVMATEFEVPRPTPLVSGAGGDMVRIQKLGDERWALIDAAPGQVWPQVRAFLSAANIGLARIDAQSGLMESAWLKLENREVKTRFRYVIEQGVQRGTSELHVLQMNMSGSADIWPAISDDLALEAEMLRAVAQYLADSSDTAPVSMIAEQAISAGGKVALREAPEGYTYIQLLLPRDRAWASLGRALEKSGFEITDLDRDAGQYYVRFVGSEQADEEEGGWFDWLFGSESDGETDDAHRYLVRLSSVAPEEVTIRLLPESGESPLDKREEQRMLVLIRGNIR